MNIYDKLVKLSEKSLKYGDVPVGAIIVKNNKIVSKSYNKREKENKIINHAEIDAILKANKKLKSYFLYDCDLYVTLKPCEMCTKVINNARISNVYYLTERLESKKEYNKTKYIYQQNLYTEKCQKMLQSFFNKLR
ncbi:MAG: nucleoside deaminase [Bacilli bacterium]|nr:nucleoside deaminase [Bacilli bacterium]